MQNIPIGIAPEVRSELARQRMTMKQLAEKSGLSYDSIRRKIKEESRDFTVGELNLIAQTLSVRVSTLILRAEEYENSQNDTKALADSSSSASTGSGA